LIEKADGVGLGRHRLILIVGRQSPTSMN
jgi:hypothetical protein